MKNFVMNLQVFSLIALGLCTLCILGAEPGTSESSMYEYEHAFDYGHIGWFLGWGWVISLALLITTTAILYRLSLNERKKPTKF
jgi:uncharacterized BrkB/YihY/UPF0761 family membrane protein